MLRPLAYLRQFVYRARGKHVELDLTRYRRTLKEICRHDYQNVDAHGLKTEFSELVSRARRGATLDQLLPQTFALVREASERVLGLRPFDVQLMAAVAMHQGKLAEMQTGEGKTLAAVLPACLNAISGQGVHVLTFNDYLARRDAEWMGPVYESLGLSVGAIQQGMNVHQRREAYHRDVTYVTAKEAGFDYLRDHLCLDRDDLVHRPFHYAIVDEADSILIDEARVPLVIAGSTTDADGDPGQAAELVRRLKPDTDFRTDEFSRNVHFTESGLDRLEAILRCGSLHDATNLSLLTRLSLALHAHVLLCRDVDYIVRDGKVEIIDEFTGRVVQNRRWPDGLQAAVEAKEGVPLLPQGTVRGSITLQHFLRLYSNVAGMTATARPAADEFHEFYDLTVVVIHPNRACVREDRPDWVFTHKGAKQEALVREIATSHAKGRPVLVGTASVAESEHLAELLEQDGIDCRVLNARNDEQEAKIVAQAATVGAVTISTNMAGRGTDIRLGGDPPHNRDKVVAVGGLYVIGTNRHESRRIDDQLRGRAGRQGDPGSSRFIVSLEDDLIERYGIRNLLPARCRQLRQDSPLEDTGVVRAVARSQRIIESQSFEIRRTLWKYSSLVEGQRKRVHKRRQATLSGQPGPSRLANLTAVRYADIVSRFGDDVMERVEGQITRYRIDHEWAEYLARVADIRENIHLAVLGNQDPLDEFHKTVGREFAALGDRIDEGIAATFQSVEITPSGIDLDKEGLRGPASTWTYLINDNPFGDVLQRLFNGLKRKLVGDSRHD